MQLKFVLHTVPLSLHCEYLWAWQCPPMHVCMLLNHVWIWNMVMGVMLFHAGFDNAAPAAFHPPPPPHPHLLLFNHVQGSMSLYHLEACAVSQLPVCVRGEGEGGKGGGITNQPWEGNKREKRRKKSIQKDAEIFITNCPSGAEHRPSNTRHQTSKFHTKRLPSYDMQTGFFF